MDTNNLEDVIKESIEDVELPADNLPPVEEATEEVTPEVAPVEPEVPAEPTTPVEEVEQEVKSPAAKSTEVKPTDSFEKKYGIPALSASGRPNRVPHDRVVKIVAKAQRDAVDTFKKEWEPKYSDLETKTKTYESQLSQVAEFEKVMSNEPARFIDEVLFKIPAYKPFFDKLQSLLDQEKAGTLGTQPDPTVQKEEALPSDMPQPDRQLADGTSVYSMEGLAALNKWNRTQAAKQAREEVMKEVNTEFGDLKKEYEVHRKIQSVLPHVQKQVDEARQWAQFTENETEITEALKANPNLSLEGAYRQVVFPKIVVDRNKVREEVLREIKAQPRATSTSTSATKANSSAVSSGPKSLEDVINESIKGLRG